MGRLIYGDSVRVHFDDHTLAHLEAVIGTKLRRGEPFMLMWRDDTAVGDGRSTVWINPGNKIAFQYFSQGTARSRSVSVWSSRRNRGRRGRRPPTSARCNPATAIRRRVRTSNSTSEFAARDILVLA